MKFCLFFEYFGYTFLNFRRYFFLYFKILIKTSFVFFLFLLFFLIKKNSNIFFDKLANKVEAIVFLRDLNNEKIKEEKISDSDLNSNFNLNLKNYEKNVENYKKKIYLDDIIKAITFVDRETVFNDFLEEYDFLKNYTSFINRNSIKNYFLIKFNYIDFVKIKNLKENIEKLDFVDEVMFNEILVKNIEKILYFINFSKKITFFVFVLILFFMYFSNIKNILFFKRNELYILDILGCNFLLDLIIFESIFLGLFSSIISISFVNVFSLFLLKLNLINFDLNFFNILEKFIIFFFQIIFFFLLNLFVYKKGQNEKILF